MPQEPRQFSRTAAPDHAAIPGWAAGFNTAGDAGDGIHPNATGDQKISDRWYPALTALLNGVSTSPPPSTTSPTPPPGGCAASYRIVGQWQGAFQGAVTVTNAGTSPINGWTVRFQFANGQQVSQSWGGQLSQSGPDVTVPNAAWNGALNPSGAAESTPDGGAARRTR